MYGTITIEVMYNVFNKILILLVISHIGYGEARCTVVTVRFELNPQFAGTCGEGYGRLVGLTSLKGCERIGRG